MAEEKNIGNSLFSWEADEFKTQTRSGWWYVMVWSLAVLGIIYAIYIQSWFFIGVVLVIVFALYVLGRVAPRKFLYTITDKGVEIGGRFYGYNSLKSFWVVSNETQPTLNFITAKRYNLLLTLQMDSGDVEKVRQILVDFLPEEVDRGEDTIDKITRFFKF